jgi:predicted RNase H-like HicB family nuclease
MTHYIGLLDGEAGGFGIVFPDLPGCAAMGQSEAEAWSHAVEALADWIEEVGGVARAPQPRALRDLRADPDVREQLLGGSAFVSVPLLMESGRSAKANISLDRGLLDAIDAAARRRGLTRSAFIASAARDKILAEQL